MGPTELPRPFINAAMIGQDDGAFKRLMTMVANGDSTPELQAAIQNVEFHRNLDCEKYNDCLMYAARCMWKGFTCRGCELFKK